MNCLIENEYIKGKTREQKKREKNSGKKNKKNKNGKKHRETGKNGKNRKNNGKKREKSWRTLLRGGLFPTSWCGVLVFDSASRPSSRPPVVPPPAQLTHTHNLLTHSLLTHNLLTHNLLTQNLHTQLAHIQLAHTQLAHTACSHTTCSHTTCPHRTCTHTHTPFIHTQWQAWHLETFIFVSRGRRGTWWHPPSFHVKGVALGDIHLRFTWQAWYLVTSTFVSRGRRGTRLTHTQLVHTQLTHTQLTHAQLAHIQLTHAGVALGDMDRHFAWQAWHVWHWAGSGGALGSHVPEWSPRLFAWQAWHLETFILVSRGRQGTWWHPPSFHVAGVVLDLLTLRGRRGTYGTGLALVARSVPTCPSGRRGFLCGRRGTWRHSSSFHVAGVVLGDVHLRFTWQAWYSTYSHTTCSHTTYSHATYSRTTCAHTTYSRRRGTWRDGSSLFVAGVARMALGWLWWRARFPRARVVAAAFCVAGVALGDIHLRFTWQAWHLVTSTFVSRGRRGTRLIHFAWQAWHVWHWASSGGALGSHVPEWSPRLFAWQAWHLETWQAWYLMTTWQAWHLVTSTFVSRGRRGTRLILTLRGRRGTIWHWASSGGALGSHVPEWSPRLFAWQAWHLEPHSSSFHVAGVVFGDIHLRFTWQAWYSTYSLCVAGVARMALG